MNEPIPKQLQRLINGLAPSGIKVVFLISRRKVPHLVINNKWSVCYFRKKRKYRIFYPYNQFDGDKQIRKDFCDVEDCAEYILSDNYKKMIELFKGAKRCKHQNQNKES